MTLSPRRMNPDAVATADPIELSTRIIDTGEASEPTNRTTNQLTELDDGLSIIESFSHVYTFDSGDGLVCLDASGPFSASAVVTALRTWRTDRIRELIYTHGHIDHVGGSGAIASDASERGHRLPEVVGHEAVIDRFHRYRETDGYNNAINLRQFGGVSPRSGLRLTASGETSRRPFLPEDTLWPTRTYSTRSTLRAGDLTIELHHARGETDDHTWAWIPERRALCVGDFVTWVFPNAGNPQKVQRYPREWAAALREMRAYDADLLLPAHGLPVRGRERIARVLDDLATVLEGLVADTLERMNAGWTLDDIVHDVVVPAEMLTRPWLHPVYDEPEFVIRNIWRLYGGWWDQDPAALKPAPKSKLAAEIAALCGGTAALRTRARELAAQGELRLACHLVEFASQTDPEDAETHRVRAEIYQQRRDAELSLMAKGVFSAAVNESRMVTGEDR